MLMTWAGWRLVGISAGGVLGVLLRHMINTFVNKLSAMPLSTFIVNLVGSFLIGIVFVVSAEMKLLSDTMRQIIMVGFLGGFTTFSSFSLDSFKLLQEGKYSLFGCYFVLSPILGLGAVFLAIKTMHYLLDWSGAK